MVVSSGCGADADAAGGNSEDSGVSAAEASNEWSCCVRACLFACLRTVLGFRKANETSNEPSIKSSTAMQPRADIFTCGKHDVKMLVRRSGCLCVRQSTQLIRAGLATPTMKVV